MEVISVPSKRPSETVPITVDFNNVIGTNEILSASTSVIVGSGDDHSPDDILSGVVTTDGSKVTQSITGGVAGVIYKVYFSVTAANGAFIKYCNLAVVSDSRF